MNKKKKHLRRSDALLEDNDITSSDLIVIGDFGLAVTNRNSPIMDTDDNDDQHYNHYDRSVGTNNSQLILNYDEGMYDE